MTILLEMHMEIIMFKKLLILLALYLFFTMDFSCFKSIDSSCMESIQDRLVGLYSGTVDYIDNTFIPFVDDKFEKMDEEKSLAGNLMDSLKK